MDVRKSQKHLWFKRKRYGWGWTPANWQGWFVITIHEGMVAILAPDLDQYTAPEEIIFLFVLPVLFIIASLVGIAWYTGESPKWQWGEKK